MCVRVKLARCVFSDVRPSALAERIKQKFGDFTGGLGVRVLGTYMVSSRCRGVVVWVVRLLAGLCAVLLSLLLLLPWCCMYLGVEEFLECALCVYMVPEGREWYVASVSCKIIHRDIPVQLCVMFSSSPCSPWGRTNSGARRFNIFLG